MAPRPNPTLVELHWVQSWSPRSSEPGRSHGLIDRVRGPLPPPGGSTDRLTGQVTPPRLGGGELHW
jgi:hypothetical protein